MRDFSKRRFDVKVTYEPVGVEYEHRYHIKCYDMNWVVIFHDSNVIDKNCFISDQEARETIRNYFNINYGIDLPV